jgi:hypothetical protein
MRSFIQRMKSRLKGRLIHSATERRPYVYLGTEYGGWPVVQEHINNKSTILSFGLGTDISFDLEAIKLFGCRVIGFDPTPRSINWLSQQHLPAAFSYHQVGIASEDGEAEFYPPKDGAHVSFSSQVSADRQSIEPIKAPVKKLSTILTEYSLPTPY